MNVCVECEYMFPNGISVTGIVVCGYCASHLGCRGLAEGLATG